MSWTVTKENGAVSFSSWLAREAAAVEAEEDALLKAFRANPPLSLKPPSRHEPDPFLSDLPLQGGAGTDHATGPGEQPRAAHDAHTLHRRMAAMAHDFNNLFTVVLGHLELVEAAVSGDSRAEDSAAEAVAAAQRGAQLTQRLMALARGQTAPSEAVDVVDVVDANATAAKPSPGKVTVLVVEDDAAVRAVAAGYIRDLGYGVIEAGDAAAALKLLQDDGAIDVLFTDVVLPGTMNGFDLSQAASLIRPELKIIHASGYPKGSAVYQDEPRLSDNLVAKPYRRDHLRRVFAATLGGRS